MEFEEALKIAKIVLPDTALWVQERLEGDWIPRESLKDWLVRVVALELKDKTYFDAVIRPQLTPGKRARRPHWCSEASVYINDRSELKHTWGVSAETDHVRSFDEDATDWQVMSYEDWRIMGLERQVTVLERRNDNQAQMLKRYMDAETAESMNFDEALEKARSERPNLATFIEHRLERTSEPERTKQWLVDYMSMTPEERIIGNQEILLALHSIPKTQPAKPLEDFRTEIEATWTHKHYLARPSRRSIWRHARPLDPASINGKFPDFPVNEIEGLRRPKIVRSEVPEGYAGDMYLDDDGILRPGVRRWPSEMTISDLNCEGWKGDKKIECEGGGKS